MIARFPVVDVIRQVPATRRRNGSMSPVQASLAIVLVGVATLANNISSEALSGEVSFGPPCAPGWAGPNCTYRCNCRDHKCGDQVYCGDDGPCVDGYFGAACQHVDLATGANASQGQVNDNDRLTCTKEPRVVLTFPLFYPFTFMRFEVDDSDNIIGLAVAFSSSPSSAHLNCSNVYRFGVSKEVFEIYCDLEGSYNTLEINWSGPGSICSIQISGGRNIALRSKASAKDHVEGSEPDHAVSGVGSTTPSSAGECYHSKVGGTHPHWTAAFGRGWVVNRILVVGRNDCCEDDLLHFRLSLYDEKNNSVYNHTDNGALVGGRYHIVLPRPAYVKSMRIETRKSGPDLQLTLCQVDVYGDCPRGYYGLECTLPCDVHCTHSICHDQTGKCPKSKCPPLRYGPFCDTECGKCSGDGSCDGTTGRCTHGCLPGFSLDTCTQSCGNCGQQSADQCAFVGGACAHGCIDTFTGSMCHKRCGFCGGNGSCTQFDGTCHFKCQQGYDGPRCDIRLLRQYETTYLNDPNLAMALTFCIALAFFVTGCFVTLGLSKKTATLDLTEATPYPAHKRYTRTASLCIPRTSESAAASSQGLKKTLSSSRLK